jgi:DNA-binding response OmpR family regulator
MKKIIIVDDDPAIQDAFKLIFPRDIFELTVFANALPVLNSHFEPPDIFILDKQLSGVDGLDLCRFIKKRIDTKNVPVIILSASPNITQLAMDAGADDILEKPFRIQRLREMVDEQLQKVHH